MSRPSLQPTILNITTKKELEPFQSEITVYQFLADQKKAYIQWAMDLSYSKINTIIERHEPSSTRTSTLCS